MCQESVRETAFSGCLFGLVMAAVGLIFGSVISYWTLAPGSYDPSSTKFLVVWFAFVLVAWTSIALTIRPVRRFAIFSTLDLGHVFLAGSSMVALAGVDSLDPFLFESASLRALVFAAIVMLAFLASVRFFPSVDKLLPSIVFAASTLAFVLPGQVGKEWHARIAGVSYVAIMLVITNLAKHLRSLVWWRPVAVALACLVFAVQFDLKANVRLRSDIVESSRRTSPNVLLIIMDTVRADHTSLNGYARDTTPNLREYAKSAIRFSRSFSSSNWTVPSHFSMFTGKYPTEHGNRCKASSDESDMPSGQEMPLAEQLAKRGYMNLAVIANDEVLEETLGKSSAFDFYQALRPGSERQRPLPFLMRSVLLRLERLLVPPPPRDVYVRAARVTDIAEHLIDTATSSGRPFFLIVNYMEAHAPYNPPLPYANAFGAGPARIPDHFFLEKVKSIRIGSDRLDGEAKQLFIDRYDGGIAYQDAQIHRLLDYLKSTGLHDNTMVIVTSDHGESFGEHEMIEHGTSLYQEQIGVPLIVKWPGQRKGEVVADPVSGVDLFPTILSAVGASIPSGIAGVDLKNRDRNHPIFAEMSPCPYIYKTNQRFHSERFSIISGEWKLIIGGERGPELFNLVADPNELHNQAETAVDARKALESRLISYYASLKPGVQKSVPAGKSQTERLKSLGYAN